VRGLEWVAADEVAGLSPLRLRMQRREVRFDLAGSDPALLELRTVDDVLVEVGRLDGVGHTRDVPLVLAERAAALDWSGALAAVRALRPLPERPTFDVAAGLEGKRNFNRFAVEDAAGAALAPRLAARFASRSSFGAGAAGTDLTVRVLLQGSGATLAVRLAARPLHRRAYKQAAGPGSLHPPLAAALVRIAGARAGVVCADLFCGDGTIVIEAALAGAVALGSDLDRERLRGAAANAERAGAAVTLVWADATDPPWRGVDALVTNPPWNVAVEAGGALAGSLRDWWPRLPGLARRVCLVANADLDASARLRAVGLAVHPHVQRVRLAGRISDVVLAGTTGPQLPPGLAGWLDRAQGTGLVGAEGDF